MLPANVYVCLLHVDAMRPTRPSYLVFLGLNVLKSTNYEVRFRNSQPSCDFPFFMFKYV